MSASLKNLDEKSQIVTGKQIITLIADKENEEYVELTDYIVVDLESILMPSKFDLLITHGRIVDGTGSPWFRADIGIMGGKIAAIRREIRDRADLVIDAANQIVAPGFIDTHQHSDLTLLANGRAESMIRQGITTAVVGLCGLSAAPVNPSKLEEWKSAFSGVGAALAISASAVDWKWITVADYLKELESKGVSQNVGTFVGHSAIRVAAMGLDNRVPSGEEMSEMKRLTEQGMRDGAFGLSTGLDFAPGNMSRTQELVELCGVVARYGGIYCSHQRNGAAEVVSATQESIDIAEASGTRLIISHLVPKLGGWGKGPALLRMIEEARNRGIDVVFDDYFETGSPVSPLTLLPAWAFEGGTAAMLNRLKNRETREKIKQEFTGPLATVARQGRWDLVVLTSATVNNKFVGRTMAEIAQSQGKDAWDAFCDISVDEQAKASFVSFFRSAEDSKLMITNPNAILETDSTNAAPYGPLEKIHDFKCYNLIPKLIRTYGREQKILTIEQLIQKLTSFPASTFGLKDRGVLKEGFWGDIVILNPESLGEKGTFNDPVHYPQGISHVVVNGEVVVEDGKHTHELAGRIIRAQETAHWKSPLE